MCSKENAAVVLAGFGLKELLRARGRGTGGGQH